MLDWRIGACLGAESVDVFEQLDDFLNAGDALNQVCSAGGFLFGYQAQQVNNAIFSYDLDS